ncbi:unnamed protein product [Meganyctiphanes norvegica]|uniref:Uncharacterized protein n=1 Tax=Meganyctiphanes norvegica TaxID=48144 RepID=A0AAV2S485_MEGNR
MDGMKEKHLKNIDMLLNVFERDTKFMSSKIHELNDKKKYLLDKQQEFLERAEKCREEVTKISNSLEQGNSHKDKLVEARTCLHSETSPHMFTESMKVATHKRQLLHNWSLKTLGMDTPLSLLKELTENKDLYAEKVIKNEKMHAKLSQK